MKRKYRLTGAKNIIRVKLIGKTFVHPFFVMIVAENSLPLTRITFVASKTVGNAVKRNRAKRKLRAVVTEVHSTIKGGWDLIFLARKIINNANYQDLQGAINNLLKQAGLKVSD